MSAIDSVIAFLVAAWAWFWPICSTIIVIVGSIWGAIKAWPQLRRAFQVGDTVAMLPELLTSIKAQTQTLEEKSDRKEKKLGEIEAALKKLSEEYYEHLEGNKAATVDYEIFKAKVEKMYDEITHNGGSSLKDAVARLELKANQFEQLPGETLEAAVKRMRGALTVRTGPLPIEVTDTPA